MAAKVKKAEVEVAHWAEEVSLITLGVVAAGFGLRGFLLPNSFIDGGVTGISLLVEEVTDFPLPVLLVLINLPFILLGFTTVGRGFAFKSMVAIVGLALVVALVPYPTVTTDTLLIAIFGGFFLGLGDRAIHAGGGGDRRHGGVGDLPGPPHRAEHRQHYFDLQRFYLLRRCLHSVGRSGVIRHTDLLYGFQNGRLRGLMDVEEYTGVTIISRQSEEVRLAIIEKLGRGCTIYEGKRGFARRGELLMSTDIVFTVVTRLELG